QRWDDGYRVPALLPVRGDPQRGLARARHAVPPRAAAVGGRLPRGGRVAVTAGGVRRRIGAGGPDGGRGQRPWVPERVPRTDPRWRRQRRRQRRARRRGALVRVDLPTETAQRSPSAR